ncbi:MAG: LamG domain-containing protein [Verrucomicrobiae bacterium]|nr:LamG domain-containing protein [Verrucomicrobiae bacterium]
MTVVLMCVRIFAGEIHAKDPQPAAWWNFDEGEGAVVKDKTGHVEDAQLKSRDGNGLPAWITTPWGKGLGFHPGTYIQAPAGKALLLTEVFTIESRVCMNYSREKARTVLARGGEGTKKLYWLRYHTGWTSWVFAFGNGGQVDFLGAKHYPNPGQWYHVAVTFDKGRVIFYLDGMAVEEKKSGIERIETPATDDLFIGAYAAFGHGLNGSIAEVKLFDAALSPEQIKREFENEK